MHFAVSVVKFENGIRMNKQKQNNNNNKRNQKEKIRKKSKSLKKFLYRITPSPLIMGTVFLKYIFHGHQLVQIRSVSGDKNETVHNVIL